MSPWTQAAGASASGSPSSRSLRLAPLMLSDDGGRLTSPNENPSPPRTVLLPPVSPPSGAPTGTSRFPFQSLAVPHDDYRTRTSAARSDRPPFSENYGQAPHGDLLRSGEPPRYGEPLRPAPSIRNVSELPNSSAVFERNDSDTPVERRSATAPPSVPFAATQNAVVSDKPGHDYHLAEGQWGHSKIVGGPAHAPQQGLSAAGSFQAGISSQMHINQNQNTRSPTAGLEDRKSSVNSGEDLMAQSAQGGKTYHAPWDAHSRAQHHATPRSSNGWGERMDLESSNPIWTSARGPAGPTGGAEVYGRQPGERSATPNSGPVFSLPAAGVQLMYARGNYQHDYQQHLQQLGQRQVDSIVPTQSVPRHATMSIESLTSPTPDDWLDSATSPLSSDLGPQQGGDYTHRTSSLSSGPSSGLYQGLPPVFEPHRPVNRTSGTFNGVPFKNPHVMASAPNPNTMQPAARPAYPAMTFGNDREHTGYASSEPNCASSDQRLADAPPAANASANEPPSALGWRKSFEPGLQDSGVPLSAPDYDNRPIALSVGQPQSRDHIVMPMEAEPVHEGELGATRRPAQLNPVLHAAADPGEGSRSRLLGRPAAPATTNGPPSALQLSPESGAVAAPRVPRRRRGRGASGGPREVFRCPYPNCNKVSSENSNLKAHMRLHTGEKPYVCQKDSCGKRFRWKSSLSYHQKAVHSNLRPYACTSCDKRFLESRKLQLHLDWCPAVRQQRTMASANPDREPTIAGEGSTLPRMAVSASNGVVSPIGTEGSLHSATPNSSAGVGTSRGATAPADPFIPRPQAVPQAATQLGIKEENGNVDASMNAT